MPHPRYTHRSPTVKPFFAPFTGVEAAECSHLRYDPLGTGVSVEALLRGRAPQAQRGPRGGKHAVCATRTARPFANSFKNVSLRRWNIPQKPRAAGQESYSSVRGATSPGGDTRPHARHLRASSQQRDI